jgi:hypothetical protein
MTREIFLSMTELAVIQRCHSADVGISTIEALPGSGVRLVCMSMQGADLIRTKLKAHLMKDQPARFKFRPSTPLW